MSIGVAFTCFLGVGQILHDHVVVTLVAGNKLLFY